MNLDAILEIFSGADGTAPVLPDAGSLVDKVFPIARILVVAGPVIMLILGLLYLFAAPKEANHHFGYRCYFGMGSEEAWQFTQRIAGITWTVLGGGMALVMLIISARFPVQDILTMLTNAAKCVVAEALVLLAASLVIRTIVAARYNRHGGRRRKQ